jgi:hypothetical protein
MWLENYCGEESKVCLSVCGGSMAFARFLILYVFISVFIEVMYWEVS